MAETDYTKDKYRKINYFETLKLTENELQAEQNYHIAARYIQNKVFRGQGIVKGFDIIKQPAINNTTGSTPADFYDTLVIKRGMALLVLEDELENEHAREIMLNFDLYVNFSQRTISVLSNNVLEELDLSASDCRIIVEGLQPPPAGQEEPKEILIDVSHPVYIYMEPAEVMEPEEITDTLDLLKGDKPFNIVEKCKFTFSNEEITGIKNLQLVKLSFIINPPHTTPEINEIILPEGRYAGIQGEQLSVDNIEFHYNEYDQAGSLNSLKPLAYIGSTAEQITDESDQERVLKVLTIRAIDLLIDENKENGNGSGDPVPGTPLEIKGDVEIEGGLTLKGNLSVKEDEDPDSKIEILADTLFIRDNIITLNSVEDDPPANFISGININKDAAATDPVPIPGDNADAPSVLFKIQDGLDEQDELYGKHTWVVNDGSEQGRLTFDLPEGNTDGRNADDAHYHSVLKYNNGAETAIHIDDDNLLIHGDTNIHGTKLSVNGNIRFLSGTLNFTPPGSDVENLLKPVSFLSYDFIFRPGSTDDKDSEKLSSIIDNDRNILVSPHSSLECHIYNPIIINNVSNLKIISENHILFKPASGAEISSVFILRGSCSHITLQNITIDPRLTLCELDNDSSITNLKIQNCRNLRKTGEMGSMLRSVGNGAGIFLQGITIENCLWNYTTDNIIHLENCTVKGLQIADNRFRVRKRSGPDVQALAFYITFADKSNEAPYREADAVVIRNNDITSNGNLLSIYGGTAERHFRLLDNQITVYPNNVPNTIAIENIFYTDVSGNFFRSGVTQGNYAVITIKGEQYISRINDNVFMLAGATVYALYMVSEKGQYTFINNLVKGTGVLDNDSPGTPANIIHDNEVYS